MIDAFKRQKPLNAQSKPKNIALTYKMIIRYYLWTKVKRAELTPMLAA